MGAALLAGDLASAWVWNPFLLVVMTGLGLLWVWTLGSVVARRPANLPGPLAKLDRLPLMVWLWLLVGTAAVFGLGRNL